MPVSGTSTIVPSAISTTNRLIDKFGREINYVRLAVTDSCNLRCVYCMPEAMRFMPRRELLGTDEILRLVRLLSGMGITKVRITGGEPFIRPDIMLLLAEIRRTPGIKHLHLTTNGVLTTPYLERLRDLEISGINLSLDTLDAQQFLEITRRNAFPAVMACLERALLLKLPIKINAVVMEGRNTDDIVALARLTLNEAVDVRFIEEMPFNGTNGGKPKLHWNHHRILERLKSNFPGLIRLADEPSSTSTNYRIPGALGSVGIIAGFSRTFCGSCNRIRITARGTLQTCLYGDGVLDLRELLRKAATDADIQSALHRSISHRFKDGWDAQNNRKEQPDVTRSMSTIGG